MKSSCINQPANERMVIIRQWQVEFCGGDHCAAAILGFMSYWHDIRLEQSAKSAESNATAERHGERGLQDTSLLQFHSAKSLREGLLGLYSESSIRRARQVLVDSGAVTEHANPNPRYAFDATTFFLFHPEVVNAWLARRAELRDRFGKSTESVGNFTHPSREITHPSREITRAIQETTSETTPVTTLEIGAAAPRKRRRPKDDVAPEPLPPGLSQSKLDEWVEYRRKRGWSVAQDLINRQVRNLAAWAAKGWDPEAIINNSLDQGYQGLFEPRGRPPARVGGVDMAAARRAAGLDPAQPGRTDLSSGGVIIDA